jgi:hypothetical protein
MYFPFRLFAIAAVAHFHCAELTAEFFGCAGRAESKSADINAASTLAVRVPQIAAHRHSCLHQTFVEFQSIAFCALMPWGVFGA